MEDQREILYMDLLKHGISNKTIEAIKKSPRELFVPEHYKDSSYFDIPISIGYGQTISQPSLVADIIDLLDIKKTDKVLDIGFGSGWTTAIMSRLAKKVYGIEIISEFYEKAKTRIDQLKIKNVELKIGDGHVGLKSKAPFNKILVSAASNNIPHDLVSQLANNGKLIIPIKLKEGEYLVLIQKDKTGKTKIKKLYEVRFVPFVISN
jgi:protein-L-isoaspartate(D-aspartate) O-methyltransferase